MTKEKYSKKKHLPLKISSNELWVEYNKKGVRRYANTNANWKEQVLSLPENEQLKLFHKYALEGNKKMLKFFIEQSDAVSVNMVDSDANSALMFAVKSGKREAVEYLLKQHAVVDHINNLGLTPLHLAVRKNSLDLVRVLLEFGADVNITDTKYGYASRCYNQTPLFDAVQENNDQMIEYLFVNGADLDHQNDSGRTPLMVAACNRHRQESLNKLIKLGANVNICDNNGRDAFMHTINNNNGAMMDILLKAGTNINVADNEGITPLMLCAKRGNREGLRVLIARGANVFAKNNRGQTALNMAKIFKNKTCEEILAKAEKIYNSDLSKNQKVEALKQFAKQNRMQNSCIR